MNIFLKTLTACLLLFIASSCTNSEEVNLIDKKHTTY